MKLYAWTLQHFAFYKQLIMHLLSFNGKALMVDLRSYVTNVSMMSFLILRRFLHGYVLFRLRKDKPEKKEI